MGHATQITWDTLGVDERPADKRGWERIPLQIPVFVRGFDVSGEPFVELAAALNLSSGGALIATRRPLSPSSEVLLQVPSAPVERKRLPVKCIRTIEARLVRASTTGACHLSGLSFVHPLT